jgi:ParB family chromosome partitioning protein
MKLAEMARVAGLTAGAEVMAKTMRPQDIAFNGELDIFETDERLVESIAQDMREKGYDKSQPLVVWKGPGCVADGRTRLKAALLAGLAEVPVVEKEFEGLEEAIRYAYRRQAERRNLTQGEILEAAIRLGIKDRRDGTGRGRENLARDLGVSESTVIHARTVATRGSPEDLEAVKKGEKTINQVYQGLRKKNEKAEPELEAGPAFEPVISEPPLPPGDEIDPLEFGGVEAGLGLGEDYPAAFDAGPEETRESAAADLTSPEVPPAAAGEGAGGGEAPLEPPSDTAGPEIEEDNEGRVDYSQIGDSYQIRFLRSSVILLCESKQTAAAKILINHFVRGKNREMFLKILPGQVAGLVRAA